MFQKIVGLFLRENEYNADFEQGLEKTIPDTPKGETPVHLRDKQLFADNRMVVFPWEKDVGVRKDSQKA